MPVALFIFLRFLKPFRNKILIAIRDFAEKHAAEYFFHTVILAQFYSLYDNFPYLYGIIIFILTLFIALFIFFIIDKAAKSLRLERYVNTL